MPKYIVSINSKSQLSNILKKDIDGLIIYLDKLSVNSSYYMTIEEILKTDFSNKELFICMNKIMHNSDLDLVKKSLEKLQKYNCTILFYDMAVYKLAKELDMTDKLMIYQDHLNTSSYSNKFYYNLGITRSFISSDITGEELLQIRKNYPGKIMFTAYGYVPIFYSRRYLITNYLKYLNLEKKSANYTIKSDHGDVYPIIEEDFGTTVYSSRPVNLINKIPELADIDYLVLNGNLIEEAEFSNIIDNFLHQNKMNDCYLGFYETKTIYRVKGE